MYCKSYKFKETHVIYSTYIINVLKKLIHNLHTNVSVLFVIDNRENYFIVLICTQLDFPYSDYTY